MSHHLHTQNYYDWYRDGPYREYVVSRSYDKARGVSSTMARQPAGDYPDPPTPELVIIQNVGSTAIPADFDNTAARYRATWIPDGFDFKVPEASLEVTVDRGHAGLFTAIDPARLAALSGLEQKHLLDHLEPLFARGARDPMLAAILRNLFDEMGRKDDPGTLFTEGALCLIAARLLRLASQTKSPRSRKNFSDKEKAILAETIDDLLDTDLSVETLALVVNRPVADFFRAFKSCFNETPHAFVLGRRIARARSMLAETDEPIASIAYACGFSSQQHMTNSFTSKLGTSPARYRKEFGP